ncbi:hypothetical protein SCUCBS95973_006971 [Sporothrix curviconia]|uniref:Uncharacterized protein n=1 Tax=Sporothrix curviconia TaxID=1260050 RepID=A0ABP0CBT2_9PEZI
MSSPQDSPSLQGYFNSSSSPIAADYNAATRNAGRSAKQHDWKQWDKDDNSGAFFAVNESDYVWHRPTFKQIVESLQVAVVSSETVTAAPRTSPPWKKISAPKPSAMSRMWRRPSAPILSNPSTFGPEYPIPGRYRSHIMRAIEGMHDIQEAYDSARDRATEVEEAYGRVLHQFSELSLEWAAREQELEGEVQRLRDELLVAKKLSPE